MARRRKLRTFGPQRKRKVRVAHQKGKRKFKPAVKKRYVGISDERLERGLRVLSETKNIKTAARAIRASEEPFKRAATRKGAIRKRKGIWEVVRHLPRKMPIFSGSRQLAITVNSKSASLVGRYMSAVRRFLNSNNPKYLAEFKASSVKDARGKTFQFETDPNELYRLSSAGGEPFEEMYRIIL